MVKIPGVKKAKLKMSDGRIGQLAECRAKAPPVGSGAKPKPTNDFVKKLESISAALVAAVFVDFPKNKYNFLHKTSMISYGGSNSSQGGAL